MRTVKRDTWTSRFNILSLPGAKVQHVKRFIPLVGRYGLITLFIDGSDLYSGRLPSEVSRQAVAESISALADALYSVCESVSVLAITQRFASEVQIRGLNLSNDDLERHNGQQDVI